MIEKRDIMKNNRKKWRDNSLLMFKYVRIEFSDKLRNRTVKTILCLILSIFIFTSVSAKPEELAAKYSIHLLGANVGEFVVTQTTNNGNININAITEIKVNLLFSFHIKYIQSTVYNQGVLQNSHVETYKNGKLNSSMWMKYEKEAYQLIVDKDTTTIKEPITYSGSLIYFNEPKVTTRIFKERNAEMRQIVPEDKHTYIIKDEKGRVLNRYFYEGGILRYATMRHTLGNVELKRVNE